MKNAYEGLIVKPPPLAVRIDKALPSRESSVRARAHARARKGLPIDYRTGGLLVDTMRIPERDSSRTARKTGHGHGQGHGHGKEIIGGRTANLDLRVI